MEELQRCTTRGCGIKIRSVCVCDSLADESDPPLESAGERELCTAVQSEGKACGVCAVQSGGLGMSSVSRSTAGHCARSDSSSNLIFSSIPEMQLKAYYGPLPRPPAPALLFALADILLALCSDLPLLPPLP